MVYFAKLCRLCISSENILVKLSSSDSDNVLLSHKLKVVMPQIEKYNNGLPNGICSNCVSQLNDSYKFIEKSLRSQKLLTQYLTVLKNGKDTITGKAENQMVQERANEDIQIVEEKTNENIQMVEEEKAFLDARNNNAQSELQENISYNNANIKMEENDVSEFLFDNIQTLLLDVKQEIINDETVGDHFLNQETSENTNSPEISNEEDKDVIEANIPTFTIEKSTSSNRKNKRHKKSNCNKIHSQNFPKEKETSLNQITKMRNFKIKSKEYILEDDDSDESDEPIYKDVASEIDDLKTHFLERSDHKLFNCNVCNDKFYGKKKFIRHYCNHLRENRYTCEICDKSFIVKAQYKKHLHSHSKKRFDCNYCGKKFNKKNLFDIHRLVHMEEKRILEIN